MCARAGIEEESSIDPLGESSSSSSSLLLSSPINVPSCDASTSSAPGTLQLASVAKDMLQQAANLFGSRGSVGGGAKRGSLPLSLRHNPPSPSFIASSSTSTSRTASTSTVTTSTTAVLYEDFALEQYGLFLTASDLTTMQLVDFFVLGDDRTKQDALNLITRACRNGSNPCPRQLEMFILTPPMPYHPSKLRALSIIIKHLLGNKTIDQNFRAELEST